MTRPPMPKVFDGHNDVLLHLAIKSPGTEESFLTGRKGHLDLPRARRGGFAGGLFAMFVPTPGWSKEVKWRKVDSLGRPRRSAGWDAPLAGRVRQGRALNAVMTMLATLYHLEAIAGGELQVVGSHRQLRAALEKGVLAVVPHLEGAEPLKKDLDALEVLHRAGIRSLGPVWSRPNAFGTGVPFSFPASPDIGPGLTSAGKELVRLCNQLGILVDLSHLNERGFWDVAEISDAPLVATHSGAHALCPSPRNLTDRQLDAIAATGGLVGVNFARAFLRGDGRSDRPTTVDQIARHIEYIASRLGEDHVALGSDFDGTQVPQDLKDVAGLPLLMDALRARGFRGASLEKIAHRNWLRVLRATWRRRR